MLEANERELFTLGFLANDLASPEAAISTILRGWNPDDLLTRPFGDVVDLVIARLSLDCPRLLLDNAWMPDLEEVDRQFEDFGRRYTRRVTRVVLVIPFEGDERIFTLRPDTRTTVPPRVYRLSNNEIRLAIDDPPAGPGEADAAFDRQIADIEKHLGWARAQIETSTVRSAIKLLAWWRRDASSCWPIGTSRPICGIRSGDEATRTPTACPSNARLYGRDQRGHRMPRKGLSPSPLWRTRTIKPRSMS